MGAKIESIQIMEVKGAPGTQVDAAEVVEGHGLAGDRHCGKSRPISLTDQGMVDWVAAQTYDGLCFHKYKTNLVLSDFDGLDVDVGARLRVGDQAVLEIDGAFKECYENECELFRAGVDCVMPGRMLFASGACGGTISCGDAVVQDA